MIIQNEEATRIIRDGAKLTLAEGFPSVLLPNVVPVMDMTPDFHRITNIVKSNFSASTGAITIYTTQNEKEKDFYLTHVTINLTKDATCDIANGRVALSVTIGGLSADLCSFSVLTLTAQDKSASIAFTKPIKIDKNTAITFAGTFTVGAMVRSASISGYIA